jgi:hypothetical protein
MSDLAVAVWISVTVLALSIFAVLSGLWAAWSVGLV